MSPSEINMSGTPFRELIAGMRATYAGGGNAMAYARERTGAGVNLAAATLIAYDLQAGSYVAGARADPVTNARKCALLAELIRPWLPEGGTLLDVGCGEATTLAGMLQRLPAKPAGAFGFDISWSRCVVGRSWLAERVVEATLFVADLFAIPLADASIDVVFTSHALEPNGGREEAALRELLRVARHAVVLIEPAYELAGPEAQARMRHHGYVRNLKGTAEALGATVVEYRALDGYSGNPLNPSGVLILRPPVREQPVDRHMTWRCPLTQVPLQNLGDVFQAEEMGLAYPIMRDIPLLRAEHAIVASKLVAAAC